MGVHCGLIFRTSHSLWSASSSAIGFPLVPTTEPRLNITRLFFKSDRLTDTIRTRQRVSSHVARGCHPRSGCVTESIISMEATLTALDRVGTVIDTDKSIWFQGRGVGCMPRSSTPSSLSRNGWMRSVWHSVLEAIRSRRLASCTSQSRRTANLCG